MKISRINIADNWKTSKNGKKYKPAGIKIGEIWYNNLLWDDKQVERLEALDLSKDHNLILEDKADAANPEKIWHNWRFPSATEILTRRVDILEQRMDKAAEMIKKLM